MRLQRRRQPVRNYISIRHANAHANLAYLSRKSTQLFINPSGSLLTRYSHANAHCIMKILKGSLTETRYAWPTVDLNNSEERPLQIISEKTYQADQVTYMSDKDAYAVSLHCKRTMPSIHQTSANNTQCTRLQMRQYTAATFSTRQTGAPPTWPGAQSFQNTALKYHALEQHNHPEACSFGSKQSFINT
jgi:hypothetical protein